ncbi:hypothetical protein vseg_003477 [Gypsophila vaccaria]
MARKSSMQKNRELNLRGWSITRTDAMNERNREGTCIGNPASLKTKGPNGDEQGKAKNIHELLGIPELEVETDEETEEEETEKNPSKQSNVNETRVIETNGTPDDTNMNESNLLQPQNEDVDEEVEYWQQAVVCYILGANPPWEVIEGFIRRIWTKFNIDKISFMPNGIFLVRFRTMEMKEKVLMSGHFLFDSKPLIVKPWSKDLEMHKAKVLNVPIWIQFHNLPLKFWGKSLPKITGLIGNYIKSDSATEQQTKLGYARVMVEVVVDKNFPEMVTFKDENGEIRKVEVQYEWKPITCSNNHKMGHNRDQCRTGHNPKVQPKKVQKV